MGKFSFWLRWLQIVAIGFTVLGLALALYPHSSVVEAAFNQFIDPIFWPSGTPAPATLEYQGWVYGLLGAVIAGWGVLMLFVLAYPFRERQRWAWNAMAFSYGLWYVIDTGASALYGVTYNVIFNSATIVALAIPLIVTRREFK